MTRGTWALAQHSIAAKGADAVAITETHQEYRVAARFQRVLAGMGFPGYAFTPGTGRACGAFLAGSAAWSPDPYQWDWTLSGRVVSSVMHTSRGDILGIVVYMNVRVKNHRRFTAEAISRRIQVADLPTFVVGDFNSSPHDEEALEQVCDYAHEIGEGSVAHGEGKIIDFVMTRQLCVREVGVDARIADHVSIFAKVEIPEPAVALTILRNPRIEMEADAWASAWTAEVDESEIRNAIEQEDVQRAWSSWSDAVESSAGIATPRRKHGTQLARTTLVWKGPSWQRMPLHERRLHRVWRRVDQAVRARKRGIADEALERRIAASIRSLVADGLIDDGEGPLEILLHRLKGHLLAEAQHSADGRLEEWRRERTMRGLYKRYQQPMEACRQTHGTFSGTPKSNGSARAIQPSTRPCGRGTFAKSGLLLGILPHQPTLIGPLASPRSGPLSGTPRAPRRAHASTTPRPCCRPQSAPCATLGHYATS